MNRKLLGVLLAVTLFVSCFEGFEVKAAPTQELVAKCNVTCEFDSSFSLVYYYTILSTGDFKDFYLNVAFQKYEKNSATSYSWKNINITDYTYDSKTKQYRFVFDGISAAEMGNRVRARLCAKIDTQVYASEYTEYNIKKYAEDVLFAKANSNSDADKKLCTLMVDMLNYGAAAQAYFGQNTGNPANKDLTSEQKALASQEITNPSGCLNKGSFSNPTGCICFL